MSEPTTGQACRVEEAKEKLATAQRAYDQALDVHARPGGKVGVTACGSESLDIGR